jgi:hypothetical protein
LKSGERLLPVGCLASDLESSGAQELASNAPESVVVVDD